MNQNYFHFVRHQSAPNDLIFNNTSTDESPSHYAANFLPSFRDFDSTSYSNCLHLLFLPLITAVNAWVSILHVNIRIYVSHGHQIIRIPRGITDDSNSEVIHNLPRNPQGKGIWKELILHPTPTVRRILIAALGIHFFQHATGIEAVVLYSPRIFQKAGIHGKNQLLLATIGVGITKTSFILVASFFLDKFGRRALLLISLGGMIVSLTSLGAGLTIVEHSQEKLTWALVLCIVAIMSNVAFYSVGLGPTTWVYSSEVFPLRLRAQGASLGVAMNRVMNSTVSMTFISLYNAITIGGSFFLFGGVAVCAWLFFYLLCPETRGVPLEEIEGVFSRGWIYKSKNMKESDTDAHIIQRSKI